MKRILIIEDNENIRENTAEILELANYKVYTAENGKTGIEAAFLEKPDLIICDVMMPVLDGFGVLHLLHKNPTARNIPLIFLTARTEREEVRKGMELGADDYITKPFTETELLNAIESRLRKVELLKEDLMISMAGLNGHNAEGEYTTVQSFIDNRDINTYKKKQVIYYEGNRPSRLFYIKKGSVKTYKTNDDGKELVVGLYNEGDFLGYVALLEGAVYREMAEALENTEVVVIPKEEFEELMKSNGPMAKQFISMLARTITEKEEWLLGMAYNSLRKKVANTLITLYKKYKTAIAISRENLATIAGTATESLIRTLGDFKNEKLIDINDGAIVILNEKKLENMQN